jgi:hypothetical protein
LFSTYADPVWFNTPKVWTMGGNCC